MPITRRKALFAGAALPVVAAGAVAVPVAAVAQETAMPSPELSRRFDVDGLIVHILLAGTAPRPDPHGIYGVNVDDAAFAAMSEANFLDPALAQMYFQPVLIEAGDARILFDTGLDPAGVTAALAHAGYAPEDVTHVVLTHHHGDHIGGLAGDGGAATFPNAEVVTGQVEFEHWAAQGNEAFEAKVRPFEGSIRFINAGDEVAPGIVAEEAYGHTPGHLAFRVTAGERTLMLVADAMHHYVYALTDPDWHVGFDSDPEMAAATRRRLLDLAASERMPVIGYHLPFPGIGFVEAREDGTYRWVPHSYQFLPQPDA